MLMAAIIQTACATRADMFIEKFLCDVCSSHDLHIGLVCAQWRGGVEESLAGVGSVYALLVNTCHSSVTFTLEFSASDEDKFRNVHIWHTETCMVTLRFLLTDIYISLAFL